MCDLTDDIVSLKNEHVKAKDGLARCEAAAVRLSAVMAEIARTLTADVVFHGPDGLDFDDDGVLLIGDDEQTTRSYRDAR